MTDKTVEELIIEKGKTAPRITPADIEANIGTEVYFTGKHGVDGAMSALELHSRYPDGGMQSGNLELLTLCVLILRNGFTVIGHSACASRENYDPEIGRKVARQDAIRQIWPLMGYELRTKLA